MQYGEKQQKHTKPYKISTSYHHEKSFYKYISTQKSIKIYSRWLINGSFLKKSFRNTFHNNASMNKLIFSWTKIPNGNLVN